MNILKKTYSKNNNEILLIEKSPKNYEKTVLIIGVVHGDEPQGKVLIENYLKTNESVDKNRMLFIPCLNPDGLENKTRQNANLVDLNRNFPTKNWKFSEKDEYYCGDSPGSENETEFLIQIIERYKPSVILAFHAPYKVVNYDGPAEEIAEEISKIINYPVQHDIGYPTPGSFGTYAGVERNIPIITLELDENASLTDLQPTINKIFELFC